MKELSIEEKARAYDKALAIAKEQLNGAKVFDYDNERVAHDIRTTVYNIFPELKESEDEKIRKEDEDVRKWLISQLEIKSDVNNSRELELMILKSIAWLEKQGEQKPVEDSLTLEEFENAFITKTEQYDIDLPNRSWDIYALCKELYSLKHKLKQGEQKPVDKAEPKFKVGDWVVYNRNDHSREVIQIYDIRDNRYYFNDNIHFSWSVKECDEKSHLWTIEDAKDGDVLVASDGSIFIYKNQRDNGVVHYVAVTPCNDLVINESDYSWERKNACHPATKDEQTILFERIKRAGYEWNEDKKELIKL